MSHRTNELKENYNYIQHTGSSIPSCDGPRVTPYSEPCLHAELGWHCPDSCLHSDTNVTWTAGGVVDDRGARQHKPAAVSESRQEGTSESSGAARGGLKLQKRPILQVDRWLASTAVLHGGQFTALLHGIFSVSWPEPRYYIMETFVFFYFSKHKYPL
jgi:hypothetical protein